MLKTIELPARKTRGIIPHSFGELFYFMTGCNERVPSKSTIHAFLNMWHPPCKYIGQMKDVLLCSNNQLLAKSLYGMLRDEGYAVETADHPATAVQMVFRKAYTALIIDFEPFGLSVDDAVRIIRTIRPEIIVLLIGDDANAVDGLSIEAPVDLAEFRQTIQTMHRLKYAT